MKRRLSCLLAFCLLLTACHAPAPQGEAEDFPTQQTDSQELLSPDQPAAPQQEEYYPAYASQPLPGTLKMATAQCTAGGYLYTGGTDGAQTALYRQDTDGSAETVQLPEGADFLYAMTVTSDGFALLYGSTPAGYLDEWGNFIRMTDTPDNCFGLALYSPDGLLQETKQLSGDYDTSTGIFKDMAFVEKGFVLLQQNDLVLVGQDGIEISRLTREPNSDLIFIALAATEDGLFALQGPIIQDASLPPAATLLQLNEATLEIEAEEALTMQGQGLGTATDGGLLLSVGGDAGGIYHRAADGSTTALLFYEAIYGALPGRKLLAYGDGFLAFEPYETSLELVQWVSGTQPAPVELTLAYTGSSGVEAVVKAFNRSQTDYHINAVLYFDGDYDRLRTEILASDAPDLYCFGSQSPSAPRERAGLRPEVICADLTALLEADSSLSRDTFVPTVLEALAVDGVYYTLPLSFAISTVTAPEALIDHAGLSLAELEAIRAEYGDLPAMPRWMLPENLLGLTQAFYLGKFVDWESSSCDFETQEFYDYLTWCKTWAGDGSLPPQDETSLLTYTILSDLSSVLTQSADAEPQTYVGFPVETGWGHLLHIAAEIGISNQTDCPDGAEAFLTYCVKQYAAIAGRNIPAVAAEMEAQIDNCANGQYRDFRGNPLELNMDLLEKFRTLLEQTTVSAPADTSLPAILSEEAAFFFSGEKTVQETAAILNERVSLYLLEQLS